MAGATGSGGARSGAGRKPTPIELKRLRGNPGKRPLPSRSQAIVVADEVPPVPSGLGAHGRALWRALFTGPSKAWIASTDHLMVEALCQLYDDNMAIRALLADPTTGGLVVLEPVVTPTGAIVGVRRLAHPLLKELRSAQKLLKEHAAALGLDPTTRSHLGLEAVKRRSVLEELLRHPQDGDADIIDLTEIAPDT